MIIYMCDMKDIFSHTIVITNRNLVKGDYLEQLKRVVSFEPYAMILREKDLSDEEYAVVFREVVNICKDSKTILFMHSKLAEAYKCGYDSVHLSFSDIAELGKYRANFKNISVSCHSLDDVKMAIAEGATQIVLGTIFETECKKGLKGKGIEFLKEICIYCKENGNIPVYAIGGIKPDNMRDIINAGANGGCMMSYMMTV